MKYIALDIGNVLCRVNQKKFVEKLADRCSIFPSEAGYLVKSFQKLHDLGYTTIEEELNFKCKIRIGSPIIKELCNEWNNIVSIDTQILELFGKLQRDPVKNLQIALLSNIGLEHAQLMDDYLGSFLEPHQTIKHFSCYVGARKPSSIYYQSFLLQYPQFTGCLYVDDLPENLHAAQPFKFKTFQFDLNDADYQEKLQEIVKLID